MSRFADSIYQAWLRANGSGTASRAAAGARARGYGAQPRGRAVPRDVPSDVRAVPPVRPRDVGADAMHSPALSVPAQGRNARARGPALAPQQPSPSLDKQAPKGLDNKLPGYIPEAAIFLSDNEDYSAAGGN